MDQLLETEVKSKLDCFDCPFDIPIVLIEALIQKASKECWPNWSTNFVAWLVELFELSPESSAHQLIYLKTDFTQKEGILTEGSLSVELANTTVYYSFQKSI